MIRRASKASVLVVSAALASMAMGASAQEFSFETNKILGSPNEVVEVPVYVKGAAVPVGGLNFTVRIASSALPDIQLDQATTSTDLVGFTYAFNANVSRTGVATGVIQGDVHEFRGVIYGTGDPAPSFDANLPVKVASILVPVSSSALGTYPVELAVDQDGVTAVGGISDVVGNSIPGGGVRPGGDDIVFDITDNFAPIVTDFTTPEGRTNWIFTAQLPAEVADQPTGSADGNGLGITTQVDNSFAQWGYDPNIGALRNPASGLLHVVKWDMNTSADGGDSPMPRLRHATANFFLSQEINLSDFGNLLGDDGFYAPPGIAGKTYTTVVEVPPFAADGSGSDGLNFFFDLLQFGVFAPPFNIGLVGETAWMSQAREYFIETSALSNPQVLYNQTYSDSNLGNFTSGSPDALGRPVTYLTDANGIGVTTSGGLDALGNLSLGSWITSTDLGFNYDSSKFYKVDFQLSAFDTTDGSFDPFWVPNVRVRLTHASQEASNNFNLNSTSFFDAAVPYLSTTPQSYSVWMNPFPEFDGVPAYAAFDILHVLSNFNGLDDNMTVYLKSLTITAYDAPVLP